MGLLKDQKIEIDACKITPEKLAALVTLLDEGKINNKAAREVFTQIAETGKNPEEIVKELGLEQIGSSAELEAIVLEIIKANPGNVQEFKSGKDRLMGFFVGQAMQKTKGKGDPKLLQELFVKHLS
jgi:aspartyl-tRNA(Asn)/glutamyl-tRNA(Gln) amidotransferase subunit B